MFSQRKHRTNISGNPHTKEIVKGHKSPAEIVYRWKLEGIGVKHAPYGAKLDEY